MYNHKKTLFSTLQGLGNSIIQWPIIEALSHRTDLTVAVMKNGSSKFYKELGYKVVEISNRKDIVFKLGLKKYDLFLTPCPSWKRECLASLVTLSNKKTLNIHSDKRYSILLPSQNINVSDPFTHDIENTTESLKQYDLTLEDISVAKEAIKKKYLDPALQNEKYVIFHPTASSEYKFYSKEFWIDLASKFSQLGYGVYIVSGPVKKEQDFCLQILEKIPTATYLKNAEFSKLCRLIRNANYFIGLDSSIMHLAATLDCQLVALWSFANFRRIYPYGMNAKIYLPEEVLKAKEFKYPKKELKELKRANAQDIIQIIQNDMKSSLQLVSKLVGPIHCYKF